MPEPDPLTRVLRVATELEQLGDEIEDYVGADAKAALRHWRDELVRAVEDLHRAGASVS